MSSRQSGSVIVGLACMVLLAFPALAGASVSPVAIGTSENDLAAIAVDSTGTAYIAWEDSTGPFLHYCKLPAGATTCSVSYSSAGQPGGLNAAQGPDGAGLLGTPSVILDGSDVLVFAYDNGGGRDSGVAGWVSTDGGDTFTQEPPGETMSYTPPNNDSTTTEPASLLGNGLIGVGYVSPEGSPQFQAVQWDPASSTFQANYNGSTGPYAILDPSNTYAVGNLGGEFAAVPAGSTNAGVLGAFAAFPSASQNPCPGAPPFVAWAYAPLSSATTQSALNTSPGSPGSAWTQPVTPLDCNTENPAVAGGAGGFGILDSAFTGGGTFYHRFDGATGKFDPDVKLSTDTEYSASLSQDSAGGVYATWGAGLTELRLAYSPNGGTTWDGPITLHDSSSTSNGLGDPASAVNNAGTGMAVYHVGPTEYAQPFTKANAILAPTVGKTGVSNGKKITVSVSCQSYPCTTVIKITATELKGKHGAHAAKTKKKTITVASGTFTLTKKGKVQVRLTKTGKALLSEHHGKQKATIVAGVKVAGLTVYGNSHGIKITTKSSKAKKHKK